MVEGQRPGHEIGQPERPRLAQQGEAGINDGLHRMLARGQRDDLLVGWRVESNTDIGLVLDHPAHHLIRTADGQAQGNVRIILAKTCHDTLHQIGQKAFAERDMDVATTQAAQFLQMRKQVMLVRTLLAKIGHEQLPGFSWFDTPRMAFEERDRQLLFEERNLSADCRRRDIQGIGRCPDAAMTYRFKQENDTGFLDLFRHFIPLAELISVLKIRTQTIIQGY